MNVLVFLNTNESFFLIFLQFLRIWKQKIVGWTLSIVVCVCGLFETNPKLENKLKTRKQKILRQNSFITKRRKKYIYVQETKSIYYRKSKKVKLKSLKLYTEIILKILKAIHNFLRKSTTIHKCVKSRFGPIRCRLL